LTKIAFGASEVGTVIHIVLVCAGLITMQAANSAPSPADLRTYKALENKAGRDPAAQVKLALWCEAHGLDAERLKHLAKAVLSDPRNAAARGLLGLIEVNGRWETPERARERIAADDVRSTKLAEYLRRRAKLTADEIRSQQLNESHSGKSRYEAADSGSVKRRPRLAQDHAELALWCKRNGLESEATAHFTVAIHLNPIPESPWKHLGYVRRGGRWTTREQAASDDRDEREQKQAERHWEPLLKKWKNWLTEKARRSEAEELLATVSDRRAISSILRVFPANASEAGQNRRVQLLGQVDDPVSSGALAAQAIRTSFDSVRGHATEILKSRPLRDYGGDLVEMIQGTIKYEVRPISGPDSQGALAIDAPKFRMLRTYDVPPAFELHRSFRGYVGYDANGLPVAISGRELDSMRAYAANEQVVAAKLREIEVRTATLLAMATETARSQLAADIAVIEATNEQTRMDNANIVPLLKSAAGAPPRLTDDEDAWHVWWYDKLGYSYQAAPKPTIAQDGTPQYAAPYIRTCFAAGTPVYTLAGARPIDEIQVGDQLLSQDAATGALTFQPVVFVHRNPPGKTLRIKLSDGGSVVCSIYHRFWRANLGWAQARELHAGDALRQLGNTVRVESIGIDYVQPVYNLDVANSRTFFVGQSNVLVHDNTLPDHRLVPFDALPSLSMQAGPRP
jgi:hypothetical protein